MYANLTPSGIAVVAALATTAWCIVALVIGLAIGEYLSRKQD